MSVQIYKTGVAMASGENAENMLLETPKSKNTASYNAYQLNLTENLVAGQTYTLQLWDVTVSHSEKTEAQTGVWVYWGGGNVNLFSWAGATYFTDGHATYLSKTFTVTETQAQHSTAVNAWLNVYNSVGYVAGTMSLTIGKWKLEKGDTATPPLEDSCAFTESLAISSGSMINTASYTPTTGTNSCINPYRWFMPEGTVVGDKFHIHAVVRYSGFDTSNTSGTFRLLWQGANFKSKSTSAVWQGTNIICTALNSKQALTNLVLSATSGTYTYETEFTVTQAYFDGYVGSWVGTRSDYSNGTATFSVLDMKIMPLKYSAYDIGARVFENRVAANDFIEI